MRLAAAAVVVSLVCGLSSACGSHSPTAPNQPGAPAPNPGSSIAVLAITAFTVTAVPDPYIPGLFNLVEKFDLTETSGLSGATIRSITSLSDVVSDMTGVECWRDPIRVPAGGTLDTFDAGLDSLGYCAPASATRDRSAQVSIVISFLDDAGRAGIAYASAPISR